MWRETEKVSIASRAGGGAGAFGVPGITRPDGKMECQNWYTCRDHFQNQNQNLQRFWFRIGFWVRVWVVTENSPAKQRSICRSKYNSIP